ncbi:MAG: Maf family protein, partial [Ruminococcus sp.]|nr:Maf family protein [Ruminococcus sp.]
SDQAAFEILKILSGKTHKVITGCAVMKGEQEIVFSQVTEVEFYPLSDDDIRAYIATGEPCDKAGAYGIQGKGALLVKQIKGDYNNVVGLPVALLNKKLKELK